MSNCGVCFKIVWGNSINNVRFYDIDGNLLGNGDTVSRGLMFEDGTMLNTNGSGVQILATDCSLQRTLDVGAPNLYRLGIATGYIRMQNLYSAQFLSAFSNFPLGDVQAIPNSTVQTITNPCATRPFQYMIYVQHENETYNNIANTHWNALYVSDYSLNGGAPVNLWFTNGPATAPAGVAYSAGGTSSYREKKSILLGPFTIVAGGSHTFQRINGSVTTIAKQGVGFTRYLSEINIKYFGRIL